MKIVLRHISIVFKKFFRSKQWVSGLIGKLLIALLIPYLILISFQIDRVLRKFVPGEPPVNSLNAFLLRGFVMLFLGGLLLQKIPFDTIRPYLHLNIKRNKISQLLLIKTIFSIKTFVVMALFTPFAFISIPESYSINEAVFWLMNIYFLIISINLLIQMIKLFLGENVKTFGIMVSLIAFTGIIGELYFVSSSSLSRYIFTAFLREPLVLLISIAVFFLLYRVNCKLISREFYIDRPVERRKKIGDNSLYNVINGLGGNTELIKFNLKQIFRNKRGKMSYFYWFGMLLFMGFLMKNVLLGDQANNFMSYFIMLLLPAGFLYQHNQFFFPWDSYQADFVHTAKIDFKEYMFARVITTILLIIPIYLLTLLLGILRRDLIYITLSSFVFNVGYASFLLILLSVLSVREIDVNQSIFFNYQGISAFQYFSVIILFLLPALIFLIFRNNMMWAYLVNGLIGLAGIVFKDKWMDLLYGIFIKKKYEILEELR